MQTNNLVKVTIGTILAVVLLTTLLIPALSSAEDALVVTKTNDYGIYASAAGEDLTVSLALNADDSTKWDWTVNGETVQYPVSITADYKPVLVADTFSVGIDYTSKIVVATASNARFTGQTEFSATITDGEISGTSTDGNTPHTYSETSTWLFYGAETGDYRSFYLLSSDNLDVYYTDIDDIYGAYFTFTTNRFFSFHGETVNYFATAQEPTEITATVNSEPVSGTVDMYTMDLSRTTGDYTFVVDNSGNDYTVHPWLFIVPASATSDALPNSDQISAMLSIIPLLVLVGLVLGVVGAVLARRD